MRRLNWTLVCLALGLMMACSSSGGSRTPSPTPMPPPATSWQVSNCTEVNGNDFVRLSTDAGDSLISSAGGGVPGNSVFSFGLVTTDQQDTLVMVTNNNLLISTDAGCSWSDHATLNTNNVLNLAAATDGEVIAYSVDSSSMYRVAANGIVTTYQAPDQIRNLGLNPDQPQAVRMAARETGVLYHSENQGASWAATGRSIALDQGETFYFAAFNPSDLDHVLVGTTNLSNVANGAGVWVTFDGAETWQQANGFNNARINAFQGEFSPSNPNVGWLLGLDVDQEGISRRAIYRTTDGGLNWTQVVQAGEGVFLTNGTPLFPHPSNDSRLFFAITDPPQVGVRRSHFYQYREEDNTLASEDYLYEELGEVWAMAVNPDHEDNLFLAISWQVITIDQSLLADDQVPWP